MLVAAEFTIDVAESLHRGNTPYWDWSHDWFFFLQIIGGFGIMGGVIGAELGTIFHYLVPRPGTIRSNLPELTSSKSNDPKRLPEGE